MLAAVLALGLRQDGQQGEEEQQQHYPLPLALPPDESRPQKALRPLSFPLDDVVFCKLQCTVRTSQILLPISRSGPETF